MMEAGKVPATTPWTPEFAMVVALASDVECCCSTMKRPPPLPTDPGTDPGAPGQPWPRVRSS